MAAVQRGVVASVQQEQVAWGRLGQQVVGQVQQDVEHQELVARVPQEQMEGEVVYS